MSQLVSPLLKPPQEHLNTKQNYIAKSVCRVAGRVQFSTKTEIISNVKDGHEQADFRTILTVDKNVHIKAVYRRKKQNILACKNHEIALSHITVKCQED